MLIGLTGTPGTGKTSLSNLLAERRGFRIIHLNEMIREEHLYSEIDEKRDAVIADMELVKKHLSEVLEEKDEELIILESHLAHYIADIVIVLRAYPPELKKRLATRGYSEEKITENAEAEALDVILVEAFDWCRQVFEVNTTGKTIEEVSLDLEKIIDHLLSGSDEEIPEYKPGSINWIDTVP